MLCATRNRPQRTWYFTVMTPEDNPPTADIAARDRSRQRPDTNGPRSLMRTMVVLPFAVLVTFTFVPNGSVLCAAVKSLVLNASPLAVTEPDV